MLTDILIISTLGARVFLQVYLKMGFQRMLVVISENFALFQSIS